MSASLFFSARFVKEKITVSITAALSGTVLLSAINQRLGDIGYTVGIVCLLSIVLVEAADRLRVSQRATAAVAPKRDPHVFI